MRHVSNKPTAIEATETAIVCAGHDGIVAGLWSGAEGRTVRCVPWRRTLMAASGGTTLYAKRFRGRRRTARAEWRWLQRLPAIGVASAQPVAWLADRHASMLVVAAVPGRSLDAWAVDAAREGWLAAVFDFVLREVAPLVARLHGQRLVHRDLNTAHLFCADPRHADGVRVIDVERVFRPRLTFERWIVKDLASLFASSPVPVSVAVAARFVRVCAPGRSARSRRRLLAAVARKAQRIAGHRPRFG